jgi:hypothetical protein
MEIIDPMIVNLVKLDPGPGRHLFLSPRQQELFNLKPGAEVTLEVGFTEVMVTIDKAPGNVLSCFLFVSAGVLKEIPYYKEEPISLVYSSPGRLSFGPTVGLGVSKGAWKKITSRVALKRRAALAHRKGILLYFFQLPSVDWEANTVPAYSLDPTTQAWVMQTIPVPEIIYDRGSAPGADTVHGFTEQGAVKNIQWLNATRTFSKWEVYKALRKRQMESYLPETALLSIESIEDFLERYPLCYVKASFGRNGQQVGRLKREGDGYVWQSGGSKTKTVTFTDLQGLYTFLVELLGEDCIIQQGISLAKFGNSPFDMRVLIQKDGVDQWQMSGINFRIGAPGAIVTNYAAGAKHMFFAPADSLPHRRLSWERIKNVALLISEKMEPYFGRLGEMGLDLGLDQEDHLWLIEVNSRPSSVAYSGVPAKAWEQIFGLPLDYAAYLVRQHRMNLNLE